jgi:TRAP-type C4-dicarboxylate transport system substrate-binding protein
MDTETGPRTHRWIGAAAVAVVVAASGCGTDGTSPDRAGGAGILEPVVLSMAQLNHGEPPAQLQRWADEVDARSGGALQIEFHEAWRTGESTAEASTIEDVSAGKVDLAWVGARVFDTVGVNGFRALVAPLVVDSYELQAAVFEAGIPQSMLDGVAELDLVGIGVLPGPMRKVLGVSRPFVAPGDFAGATIGMQDSGVARDALNALGATALPLPSSADLDGVDGAEQQLASIVGNHYWTVARYVTTNINLWPRPLVIIGGESAFGSLSSTHQAILREAAEASVLAGLEESKAEDNDATVQLCRQGMELVLASASDLADLRHALAPVHDALRSDPITADHLDSILALKDEVGAEPESPMCEEDDLPDVALPNGLFETNITSQDWAAAGMDGPASTFTLEISEHSVTIRQDDEIGFSGTYTLFREDIEVSDGVDSFTARWSYDGTTLTFADVQPADSPFDVVWSSHPWQPAG